MFERSKFLDHLHQLGDALLPGARLSSVEDFAIFDQLVPPLDEPSGPPALVRDVTLGETMVLQSAGLVRTSLNQGDTLLLALVWRPLLADTTDYKLFVHLSDESGQPVAQWDGYPCFNTARTSQWAVGESVRDHVLLPIPEEMPTGEYAVVTGLYDEVSGERLGGQAVEIGTITIR